MHFFVLIHRSLKITRNVKKEEENYCKFVKNQLLISTQFYVESAF